MTLKVNLTNGLKHIRSYGLNDLDSDDKASAVVPVWVLFLEHINLTSTPSTKGDYEKTRILENVSVQFFWYPLDGKPSSIQKVPTGTKTCETVPCPNPNLRYTLAPLVKVGTCGGHGSCGTFQTCVYNRLPCARCSMSENEDSSIYVLHLSILQI